MIRFCFGFDVGYCCFSCLLVSVVLGLGLVLMLGGGFVAMWMGLIVEFGCGGWLVCVCLFLVDLRICALQC